jgi:hypothetical protein
VATAIDILHLFPELAAIGPSQLQDYCDAWVKRPIAWQNAVAKITVDEHLMLHVYLAAKRRKISRR